VFSLQASGTSPRRVPRGPGGRCRLKRGAAPSLPRARSHAPPAGRLRGGAPAGAQDLARSRRYAV